jgi:hypothetical protein
MSNQEKSGEFLVRCLKGLSWQVKIGPEDPTTEWLEVDNEQDARDIAKSRALFYETPQGCRCDPALADELERVADILSRYRTSCSMQRRLRQLAADVRNRGPTPY